MNQILVTEKLYVTPELKRKKKFYKFNFILSIFVIVILISFYVYAEYDRTKKEDLSQDILSEMILDNEELAEAEEEVRKNEEEVWKIIIASNQQFNYENTGSTENEQSNMNETNNQNTNQSTNSAVPATKKYKASNGKTYNTVGSISIPKIKVNYPILDEATVAQLRVSPCKFYGPNANEIGNFCVAGHNWRNNQFFSKVPKLVVGDIIKITDLSGRTIKYSVYDKYTVVPEDTGCTSQRTDGKKIVTLITCTNDSKKRVIIQAKEVV